MASQSRLRLAGEAKVFSLPDEGKIAVFHPEPDEDLGFLDKTRLEIIQPFKPFCDQMAARGFNCAPVAEGSYSTAIVFLPRAKKLARHLVAKARELTAGPVIIDGQKTNGVDSLIKALKSRDSVMGQVFAKAHGKTVELHHAELNDWIGVQQPIAEGLVTFPGVFSADGIDTASKLLAEAIGGNLSGRVADLGSGWGYLAKSVLSTPNVAECALVEADYNAHSCAQINVDDTRARFHWADVNEFSDKDGFDHIVTNPPFHIGRAADPALGQKFIQTAQRLLKRNGTLWLVANRHLPYEVELRKKFVNATEINAVAGFKVFRAERPRREKS